MKRLIVVAVVTSLTGCGWLWRKTPEPVIPPLVPIQKEVNIDPALLDDQFKTIESLSKNSPVEVRFSMHGITLDEMKNYYQNRPSMKQYFCKAPWNTMLLSPKGQVMPCYYAPLGNVRQHTVSELWNGWAAKEFRRMIRDQKFLPGCVGCCNGQFGKGEAVPIFS